MYKNPFHVHLEKRIKKKKYYRFAYTVYCKDIEDIFTVHMRLAYGRLSQCLILLLFSTPFNTRSIDNTSSLVLFL